MIKATRISIRTGKTSSGRSRPRVCAIPASSRPTRGAEGELRPAQPRRASLPGWTSADSPRAGDDPALARGYDGRGSRAHGFRARAGDRRGLRMADGAAGPPLRFRVERGALDGHRRGRKDQPGPPRHNQRRGRGGRRDGGSARACPLRGNDRRRRVHPGAAASGRATRSRRPARAADGPGRRGGGDSVREGAPGPDAPPHHHRGPLRQALRHARVPAIASPAFSSGSAGRMDERAHLFFFSQLAVEPYRLLGLPDVRGDAPIVQFPQGLRSDAESFVEAFGEDYRGSALLQQLFDVGGLDARLVAGAGLVPVPLPRASREKLGVFEGAILAFDVQAPPGEASYSWRTRFLSHRGSPFLVPSPASWVPPTIARIQHPAESPIIILTRIV